MTCRPGARPTTPCCRRCPASMPTSGRTWRCSPSSRRWPPVPNLRPVAGAQTHHRKRPARFPPLRRRTAGRQKPRFKEIQEELSALGAKFSENVLDATNAHAEWIEDEAGIKPGCPRMRRRPHGPLPRRTASQGWKFTLHAPSYIPVLQFCDNRDLRARMYRAYATRASEFGPAELRQRAADRPPAGAAPRRSADARLRNFAEVSLATKMADTPAQVAGLPA
jgi:oligopeptidase A